MATMARTLMKTISGIENVREPDEAGLGDAGSPAEAEVLRLFTANGLPLYRFCRSMLRSSSDAEDVVQDTFVKLLLHLRAGGDRSNLRAWLFAVAANACRDRSKWSARWLPWRPELDRRTVPGVTPGFEEEDGTDRRRARAALDTLAPRDRLLLTLRAEGLSYREMSVAAGIVEKSVGRLLARAVTRWKETLASSSRMKSRGVI